MRTRSPPERPYDRPEPPLAWGTVDAAEQPDVCNAYCRDGLHCSLVELHRVDAPIDLGVLRRDIEAAFPDAQVVRVEDAAEAHHHAWRNGDAGHEVLTWENRLRDHMPVQVRSVSRPNPAAACSSVASAPCFSSVR